MTDRKIRPDRLNDYLGQESIKEQLGISISAAKQRGECLDHVLLFGPPGLGKTTLANIIGNEMGVQTYETTGPVIERPGDLVSILVSMKKGDVLFIDEIHRLPIYVQETLYSAMEDWVVDIIIEDDNKKSIRLPIEKFTLVGATTRAGLISAPMRDRFGITHRLEFYTHDELTKIIKRNAGILNTEIDEGAAMEIAKSARGTPRIANRLLRRIRDVAQTKNESIISSESALEGLLMMGYSKNGLDEMDQKMMRAIIDNFSGGPVGIDTLSSLLSEDKDTLETVVEPYLIQQGWLEKTPRGRKATQKAVDEFKSL